MDPFTGSGPPEEVLAPSDEGASTEASGEANSDLAPDPVQIKAFLRSAANGSLQLASIHPLEEGRVPTQLVKGDLEAAVTWIIRENARRNIYYQPNPVVAGLNKKAGKADITAAVCTQVDIDPPKDGTQFNAEAVRARLLALSVPPSSINFTGGGVQAVWRLDVPTADFERVEAVSKSIASHFEGDHCHAINHLMRVPGTINWPTAKKAAAGRKPALATTLQPYNGRRYSLEELEAEFSGDGSQPTPHCGDSQAGDYEMLTAADLGHTDRFDPLRIVIDEPAGIDGSRDALLCAGDMMRHGYSREQVVGVLLNPANAVHAHLSRQTNPLRTALRIISKVWMKTNEDGAGAQSNAGAGSPSGKDAHTPAGSSTQRADDIEALDLIDPVVWKDVPVEPRRWVLKDFIPMTLVTLFTGLGSVGKSLAMQQAATAAAMGKTFLGVPTIETVSAYFTFEDDERELHSRQIGICNAQNVHLSDLSGKLFLASMAGLREKGLVRFDHANRMVFTALFERLKRTIGKHNIRFLVLDNVAHIFEGNEIVRAQVAGFLGALHVLALETDCTIVLIAHPNKQGDSYSGSTAWQNQVRSQIALEKDENDRERRLFKRVKANYAQSDEEVALRWYNGAFVREDELDTETQKTFLQRRQEELFLRCLDTRNQQERPVSVSKNASTYAPREFAGMAEAQGLTAMEFAQVMERLFSGGKIETGELNFDKPASRGHRARGIRRAMGKGNTDEAF